MFSRVRLYTCRVEQHRAKKILRATWRRPLSPGSSAQAQAAAQHSSPRTFVARPRDSSRDASLGLVPPRPRPFVSNAPPSSGVVARVHGARHARVGPRRPRRARALGPRAVRSRDDRAARRRVVRSAIGPPCRRRVASRRRRAAGVPLPRRAPRPRAPHRAVIVDDDPRLPPRVRRVRDPGPRGVLRRRGDRRR